ncbi:MAG TPA: response regulator transcription factor [Phycisphaerales bacterium]|nr:response regulator transcription factor [Phycisphaerales bacterium]
MIDTHRPLRVLCVDDNDLVARSLSRRVRQEQGLDWLGVITDTSRISERVVESAPDIVLMDIDMPGVDTFGIVDELASRLPTARIVMFSGHIDAGYIQRALDSSAWGYLSKHDDVSNLISSIRRVGNGEIVFSRDVEAVRDRLLEQLRPGSADENTSTPLHASTTSFAAPAPRQSTTASASSTVSPAAPSQPSAPDPDRQIKVIVVDDEPRLCTAWSRILRSQPDFSLVASLHAADELESHVQQHQPDVILLDLSMPGLPPLDALRMCISRFPSTRFLIYSGHHDRDTAQRVADAGAHGLVDKLEAPDAIITAMRNIAAGGKAFAFSITTPTTPTTPTIPARG